MNIRLRLPLDRACIKKYSQNNTSMHIMHNWDNVILGGVIDSLGMFMEEKKIALGTGTEGCRGIGKNG